MATFGFWLLLHPDQISVHGHSWRFYRALDLEKFMDVFAPTICLLGASASFWLVVTNRPAYSLTDDGIRLRSGLLLRWSDIRNAHPGREGLLIRQVLISLAEPTVFFARQKALVALWFRASAWIGTADITLSTMHMGVAPETLAAWIMQHVTRVGPPTVSPPTQA